ncbi:MAG: flagellar motor switch protein FliM [Proteobacteria bacterium]|nr:flagellar motor switch protein FliM [Pseudomonadota bacterium]HQR05009.1 flagellar motor switch protein FliM [Rhodocyclaceae bacterium]
MSQDFLSQEEVDALLKGVASDTDEIPRDNNTESVQSYDLGRQERIVRGRMASLDLINERFVRNLRAGLFNYMQRNVEISLGPVRIQQYSEFVRNLSVPASLNLIQVKPLQGTGLIVLDPNLVFLVVDNLFGGDGRFHTRAEGRDFTTTEQRIVQGLLKVVFEEYEKSWRPTYPVKFEYLRSEMNPQFAAIVTPSETIVAMTFTLELSGNTVEMQLCLPYSMIEPIRDVLSDTTRSEQPVSDKRWATLLTQQLQLAEIELHAPLGTGTIRLGDILAMQVGDIVPLEMNDRIVATAEGIPVLKCRYGVHNGQYALKVEQFILQEEDEQAVSQETPA